LGDLGGFRGQGTLKQGKRVKVRGEEGRAGYFWNKRKESNG